MIPPPAAQPHPPDARPDEPVELIAEVDGRRFQVRLHGGTDRTHSRAAPVRRPPAPARPEKHLAGGNGALLPSPIQGTVVRVAADEGAMVHRGQIILAIEAMKMENDVAAHRDGTLTRVIAAPGMAVRVGDPLAEIT